MAPGSGTGFRDRRRLQGAVGGSREHRGLRVVAVILGSSEGSREWHWLQGAAGAPGSGWGPGVLLVLSVR